MANMTDSRKAATCLICSLWSPLCQFSRTECNSCQLQCSRCHPERTRAWSCVWSLLEIQERICQMLPQLNKDRSSSKCVQLDGYVCRSPATAYISNQCSEVLPSSEKLANHSSTEMPIKARDHRLRSERQNVVKFELYYATAFGTA